MNFATLIQEGEKMDCLFCKIARHEVDSKILYEDDKYMAFLDINQEEAEGHTLIIPKKHVKDYTMLDKGTLNDMFEIAQKLNQQLMTKLNKSACTLLFNYGDSQVIKHTHLHLLPNYLYEKGNKDIEEIYRILKEA